MADCFCTAKRSAPGAVPQTPAQKITKPACKYGVPLAARKVSDAAKKPAERKPAVKSKAVGVAGHRQKAVLPFSASFAVLLSVRCV